MEVVLDIFALVVLLVLLLAALAVGALLGWLPGHIAAKRGHPQADAIKVCGWLGVLTMGVLLPVAFIWAFTKAPRLVAGPVTDPATIGPAPPSTAAAATEN